MTRKAIWTDKREKLLILALDKGATDGEAKAAGSLLLDSWRGGGVSGYDVLEQAAGVGSQSLIALESRVRHLEAVIAEGRRTLEMYRSQQAGLQAENKALHAQINAMENDGDDEDDAVDRPDYGRCIMPFGKYKGRELRHVPPDYLQWVLGWIEQDEGRSERFEDLVQNIRTFLDLD